MPFVVLPVDGLQNKWCKTLQAGTRFSPKQSNEVNIYSSNQHQTTNADPFSFGKGRWYLSFCHQVFDPYFIIL
jgi:hypothetical protein